MVFLKLITCATILSGSIFHTGITAVDDSKSTYRNETIKIGLLIDNKSSLAAVHAAELAISEANSKAGIRNRKYELVVRSMEGPWGTGSKQTVDLIFDENVAAIAGSHGGRNAHLAEQVCAKSRVILISARASDPTLTQAFVPWYYSCVPNDNQQAAVLSEEVFNRNKESDVLLVSDNDYDARQASQSMITRIKSSGLKDPELLRYDENENDLSGIAATILKSGKRCIVLFGKPPSALNLLREIRKLKYDFRIYTSLSMMDEDKLAIKDLSHYEGLTIISPFFANNPKWTSFSKAFLKKFGYEPGVIASYSYDAINVIIEAIDRNGPDQEMMQKTIEESKFEGLSGIIEFDKHGNRKEPFSMITIKNGAPILVK